MLEDIAALLRDTRPKGSGELHPEREIGRKGAVDDGYVPGGWSAKAQRFDSSRGHLLFARSFRRRVVGSVCELERRGHDRSKRWTLVTLPRFLF